TTAGSIPEVCGDAAAYFDPRSVDEMAAVIERTLGDDTLRCQLKARGAEWVKRYSWPRAAAQIADVFERVQA
ncbi:MAG TPA: hypothetical protein VIV65_05675, partial [Gemmatimonadaceae bacterium]